MPLSKALIVVIQPKVPVPIPVLFNPPEYQLVKSNQFAEIGIPGLGSGMLQFVRGSAQTLTMDLFFDTTALGVDVRSYTDLVVGLTGVNAQTHAPPRLLFLWGSLVFPCVLENVTQRFLYFAPGGIPLRGQLSVTLRGDDLLETLLASVPFESADRAKGRVVRSGDTLERIAAEEYGDARRWRPIAHASGIDNPLTLRVGQTLTIPPLT